MSLDKLKKEFAKKFHGIQLGHASITRRQANLNERLEGEVGISQGVGFNAAERNVALGKLGYVGSAPKSSPRPPARKRTKGTKVNVSPRPKARGK